MKCYKTTFNTVMGELLFVKYNTALTLSTTYKDKNRIISDYQCPYVFVF